MICKLCIVTVHTEEYLGSKDMKDIIQEEVFSVDIRNNKLDLGSDNI